MQSLDVRGIANYILDRAPIYNIKGLNLFKLMKLVYLIHGWSMAFDDMLYINQNQLPKAWDYNVVYIDIYNVLRKYSINPVKERIIDKHTNFPFAIDLTNREKNFMDTILRRYMYETSYQLSLLIQAKNSPWYKARKNKIEDISMEDMEDYFLQLRKNLTHKKKVVT